MDTLKRISGIFLVLMAVAVAVHTVGEPLYHTSSKGQPYSPLWDILDPLMALAIALGVIFGYLRKKAADSEGDSGAVTREFVAANAQFYGFLFVGILCLLELVYPAQSRIHRSRSGNGQPRVDPHRRHAATAYGRDGRVPAAGRQTTARTGFSTPSSIATTRPQPCVCKCAQANCFLQIIRNSLGLPIHGRLHRRNHQRKALQINLQSSSPTRPRPSS